MLERPPINQSLNCILNSDEALDGCIETLCTNQLKHISLFFQFASLNRDKIQILIKALQNQKYLTKLDLKMFPIEGKCLQNIGHTTMHRLLARIDRLSEALNERIDKTATLIITSIEQMIFLESLTLRGFYADNTAACLKTLLNNTQNLTHLSIECADIKAKGAKPVLSDEGIAILAAALKRNNTLTSLTLKLNQLNPQGGLLIARALSCNSSLKRLDLSDTVISHESVVKILERLKSNTTLKEIIFTQGFISTLLYERTIRSPEDFEQSIDFIDALKPLHLNLAVESWHDFSDNHLQSLSAVLSENTSLQSIVLSNFPDFDFAMLCKSTFKKHPSLEVLSYDGEINALTVQALISLIKNNQVLKKLSFGGYFPSDSINKHFILKTILDALSHNKTLRSLDLSRFGYQSISLPTNWLGLLHKNTSILHLETPNLCSNANKVLENIILRNQMAFKWDFYQKFLIFSFLKNECFLPFDLVQFIFKLFLLSESLSCTQKALQPIEYKQPSLSEQPKVDPWHFLLPFLSFLDVLPAFALIIPIAGWIYLGARLANKGERLTTQRYSLFCTNNNSVDTYTKENLQFNFAH